MIEETPAVKFSVIIPLEFHRGQVELCLDLWVRSQRYPRDQYEIVAVGCRTSLDADTISFFKGLLSDRDRLLLHDEPHDMALIAYGAKHAKGRILFFTESHCLPEADILSVLEKAFSTRSDCAGFSCQSVRVTHNSLSVVEADMYEKDIRYGMEHLWRRILDQCFAVRVEDYHAAGGFEPEFGHFAEWVLSAKMHKQNKMIGYLPEAKIHHHYSGELPELFDFTRDFVHGELLYHADGYGEATYSYFTEPDEWRSRYQWVSAFSSSMLRLLLLDYWNLMVEFVKAPSFRGLKKVLKYIFFQNILIRSYLKFIWLTRAYLASSAVLRFSNMRLGLFTLLLQTFIKLHGSKKILSFLFLRAIDASVQYERTRFIDEWLKLQKNIKVPLQDSLTWMPNTYYPFPVVGIHSPETWENQHFQWSEPAGMVEVRLPSGRYEFKIEWLPIKPIRNLRIYVNEKAVPFQTMDCCAKGDFEIETPSSLVYFAWTCEAWKPPREKRILGLPVKHISITPI